MRHFWHKYFLPLGLAWLLWLIGLSAAIGQQKYQVVVLDSTELLAKSKSKLDSTACVNFGQEFKNRALFEGYVFATMSGPKFTKDTCFWYAHRGVKYHFSAIDIDTSLTDLVKDANLNHFSWPKQRVDSLTIERYARRILARANNSGYPFANLYFSQHQLLEDGSINGKLAIDKGPFMEFDTMFLYYNNIVHYRFFEKLLQIKKGQPYNHEAVLAIKKRLNDLPFLKLEREPTVNFVNNKAITKIFISPQKASVFDFILGFQPTAPTTVGTAATLRFTGQLQAQFINKLNRGEEFKLDIRRLTLDDQMLQLFYGHPYIFGSSFGGEVGFEIRKSRNISTDVTTTLGLQRQHTNGHKFSAQWISKSSRLFNVDTNQVLATKRLPPNLDYNIQAVGFGWQYENLSLKTNPRSGQMIAIRSDFGIRTIVENIGIVNLQHSTIDFSSAYDSLAKKTTNIQVTASMQQFFPVKTWATFRLAGTGGYKYAGKLLLDNERFRIGGLKLLRGFDEWSILTNFYGVGTAEFRFILDEKSYLTLPFVDVASFQRNGVSEWAISTGFGINFATKAGLFNVAFAVGKTQQLDFDFGNTKVHFGYLSLF